MNVTSRNDRAELSLVCPLGLYDNIYEKERASVLNQKAAALYNEAIASMLENKNYECMKEN